MSPPLPSLLDVLPGPWTQEATDLPQGGPRTWWRGPAGVILGGPPARMAEELDGWSRLGAHPARPALREIRPDCVLLGPIGGPVEDPVQTVRAWPRGERWVGPVGVREALHALGGRTDPGRALHRLGARRRHIDRLLASTVEVATWVGPGPGGLAGGWLRESEGGPVALRWASAGPDRWFALELAAVGLSEGEDLRELHREGLPPAEADRAYDLALLRRALDEAILGDDEGAASEALTVFARLAPGAEPEETIVFMENLPDFIHEKLWIPAGGRVPAARARWLLHNLDGLWVGGQQIRIHTSPALRAGHAPPPRSPQAERRRALFSRWEQGVQVDEEGLWSATPEALAAQLARGLRGRVMDGTCGLGCVAIQLALNPHVTDVTAVDIHERRLKLARHNAGVYGVAGRVSFVEADVVEALRGGGWDALVLDPPWGGRGYDRERVGVDALGLDLRRVMAMAPPRVRVKLPRSLDVAEWRAELPGPWRFWPLVDQRGLIKALVADRGGEAQR